MRQTLLYKVNDYKYNMLVTIHAIWYVIAELLRRAWQKDLRDITVYVMEEMIDAKKDEAVFKPGGEVEIFSTPV